MRERERRGEERRSGLLLLRCERESLENEDVEEEEMAGQLARRPLPVAPPSRSERESSQLTSAELCESCKVS